MSEATTPFQYSSPGSKNYNYDVSSSKVGDCEQSWIFSSGLSGVVGNEQTDRLADATSLRGDLMHDRADVVKALWEHVNSAEEQIDYHGLDRMRRQGMVRGYGRQSSLRVKARRTYNQIAADTISSGTNWLLEMMTEHLWECPQCSDVDS